MTLAEPVSYCGGTYPLARARSPDVPRFFTVTSTKLRCSGDHRQNLHGSKLPVMAVEQLRHASPVTSLSPPQA